MQSFGATLRSHFLLDERLCFLNHGSFGACPKSVLEAQDAWRSRFERDPIRFVVRVMPEAMRRQASELAAFLGAVGEDLAFVENATTGVSAVVRSLDFEPGDEILVLSHVYPAVHEAVRFVAKRSGARVVEVELPVPLAHSGQVLEAVAQKIGPRTRLAVLDHVTSFSALVLPAKKLVELCHQHGAQVLVDGAHAPGMLELDLNDLGADFYVGNCHKWLWAPKGCAFLHVQKEHQEKISPPVISLRQSEGFPCNFDWTGTKDPSAYLSLGAALEFHAWLGGHAVAHHNRDLVIRASEQIAGSLGWELVAPAEMTGSIRAMRIPGTQGATHEDAMALHDFLADTHHIEAHVHAHEGLWLRLSAQVYNEMGDYAALLAGLKRCPLV